MTDAARNATHTAAARSRQADAWLADEQTLVLLTEVDLHDTYPLARLGEQETVVTQGVPTHSDSSCLIMPGEWMGDPWLRLQKHVVANAHRRLSSQTLSARTRSTVSLVRQA